MQTRVKVIAVAVGATAAMAAGVGVGYAATGRVSHPAAGPYHVCVDSTTHEVTKIFGGAHPTCKAGKILYLWNTTGPRGAKGATGARGPAGPPGVPGPAGAPAVTSVTAVSAVSNWPETSGWATDNFTRTIVLTRQHAAASSDCGGTAECWFYTGTIADSGTSTTVDGAASPNGSSTETIHGSLNVTMVGGAHVEFYASNGTPNPGSVPATVDGGNKPATTSTWYELAFPNGTTFKSGSLTQYSWTYTYGPTCEQWVDSVNPGDDGQGSGDGNITGINNC